MQQKLTGISISGQASLKTLAFADNCVLGLSSNQDATIANDLISKYESVSQAKLNADKSHAISKGLSLSVLFRGIKYSTTPIRHLGIHVNSTGICTELMEDMIATKISSQIAQWSLVNPTIHGKCLLINTFLTSKIWYFTHAFPVSEKFLERISNILKSWLWPNTRAPILLSKLFGHKSTGGLGLLIFSSFLPLIQQMDN